MNSALLLGGSGGIGRLMAWLGNLRAGDEALYSSIVTQLSPEAYLQPLKLQYYAADRFNRQLFSCGKPGAPLEAKCSWAAFDGSWTKQDGTFENFRASSDSYRFSLGTDREIAPNWRVLAAVGYQRLDDITVEGPRARGHGDGLQVGLGIKHLWQNGADLAATVTGGYQWTRFTRETDIFQPLVAHASPKSGYLQASLSAGATYAGQGWYLRPQFTGTVTALQQENYAETGVGGLGFRALGHTQVLGSFSPEVYGGFDLVRGPDTTAAITVSVGGLFQVDKRVVAPFRLLGANPDAYAARLGVPLDGNGLRVGADLVIARNSGFVLQAGYATVRGKSDKVDSAHLKLSVKF